MKIVLQGSENLKRMLDEFPDGGFKKPVTNAFRKAAEPVRKAMISSLPSNLSQMKRIVKAKPGKKGKNPSMAVGFFFNEGLFRNKKGKHFDAYTILFWHNYGTLDWRANRFYNFRTPVRRKTKAGTMAGIRPGLFAEKGWDKSKGTAQRTFEESADFEMTKFLNDRALK
jgi:hypothetical protein